MTYIHPHDKNIDEFIRDHLHDRSSLKSICSALLKWFDQNVQYSRLNAPFFPLQRSDLDVLRMRSGTCGDYSNLLVSIMQKLGYEAGYAYVHRDCYGDEQDHICAAVREAGQWILIDATQPYRKWHGFNCPHQDYELLTPSDFEKRMKKEELYWTDIANRYGNELYAGLLYAPWIHEEIISQSENTLESVFFLLILDKNKNTTLYAYSLIYSKECSSAPFMSILANGTQKFCFSCSKAGSIWDNKQWSQAYTEVNLPVEIQTDTFRNFKGCISRLLPVISKIMDKL